MNKFKFLKVLEIPARSWGDLLVRDINTEDSSSNLCSFTQIELPPNKKLPLIRHRQTVEAVYILEGTATVLLDNVLVKLEKWDYLCFDKGVAHSFTSGDQGVKALSLYFPPIEKTRPDVEIVQEQPFLLNSDRSKKGELHEVS